MSGYLKKYVGTYRVLAEYDRATNDWIRDTEGNIDASFDDFYIPLKNNAGRIMHYDRNILILLLQGNRFAKGVIKELVGKKDLVQSGLAEKVRETDEGYLIWIKDSNLEKFVPYIHPVTLGAKIQPFSIKNLPKQAYDIPETDLVRYKEAIKGIDFKALGLKTRHFLADKGLQQEQRKSGLTAKEFVHKKKLWENYLKYLTNS